MPTRCVAETSNTGAAASELPSTSAAISSRTAATRAASTRSILVMTMSPSSMPSSDSVDAQVKAGRGRGNRNKGATEMRHVFGTHLVATGADVRAYERREVILTG